MAGKRPTLVDLAQASGFSVALVSIVMRDAPGASEETRRRVKEVAEQIGYQPNWLARGLRSANSGLIGVCFAISHPFHADLVRHLYQASFGKPIDLVLSAHLPGRSEETAAVTLLDKRCEAVVLLGSTLPEEAMAAMAKQVPVVAVARRVGEAAGVDVVRSDDYAGAAMAVDHLVELGHVRIAHIDGASQAGAPERRDGYRDAMVRHGLGDEVRIVGGGIEESDGYGATLELFGPGPGPTAVLAFNDECAAGVLSAAAVLGRDVPSDLAVVGYDDSRRALTTRVPLTSLAQTYEALAKATIDRVEAQITERGPAIEVVTEPQLVVRESTAGSASKAGGLTSGRGGRLGRGGRGRSSRSGSDPGFPGVC